MYMNTIMNRLTFMPIYTNHKIIMKPLPLMTILTRMNSLTEP